MNSPCSRISTPSPRAKNSPEEICPVYVNGKAITEDNGPRADTSLAALGKLKPVFDRRYGTVTAGNSSQISDGAVALLVMTEEKAAELGFSSRSGGWPTTLTPAAIPRAWASGRSLPFGRPAGPWRRRT